MVSDRRRVRGLTLLEVIVVIVIVVLLLVLLIPSAGHAPHGRAMCKKNLKEIGLATSAYVGDKGTFPGYANKIGGKLTSWVVPLLPYLDERAAYQKWNDPKISIESAPVPEFASLICPNDLPATPHEGDAFVSYVVNAGEAMNESAANGICHDLTRSDPVTVNLDYLQQHDGAAHTLLATESLLAGRWTVPSVGAAKLQGTFVWHKTPTPTAAMKPNGPRDGITRPIEDLRYARPSSNHNGGFNVVYADSHVSFINDDIDYDVYRQLMTPNSAESDDPVKKRLRDADYD